ncbi:hypothetical protein [Stappia sp.]|uniref:hypothetical protein n=1 Tax=Stappia sp. TaxID=1870903 RepID=UPI003A9945A0
MRGWRTFAVNALTAAGVAALEALRFLGEVDWAAALGPHQALWIVVAVNLANIALRHITGAPAGWRRAQRREWRA